LDFFHFLLMNKFLHGRHLHYVLQQFARDNVLLDLHLRMRGNIHFCDGALNINRISSLLRHASLCLNDLIG